MTPELVCPRDRAALNRDGEDLVCSAGHRYRVPDGVPVLLAEENTPTQIGYWATAEEVGPPDAGVASAGSEIDDYVRWVLRGTCGNLYDGANITRYPIPVLPLAGPGRLLDIGSNWGRWTIAAARAGFEATGIDPSLGAIQAARRVSAQLDAPATFVVADGRHVPFPDSAFDVVFSYGVLQHLSPTDVREAVEETARVVKPGGISLHQFPNSFGLLSLYRQARRGFRRARAFEVRYWSPGSLRRMFEEIVGPTTLSVDAFFTLNPHPGDVSELRRGAHSVVKVSRVLTRAGEDSRLGVLASDSVWVRAVRRHDAVT